MGTAVVFAKLQNANFLKSTAQHDLKSRPYPRVYGYMTIFLMSNEHYDINWLNYLAKPTQSDDTRLYFFSDAKS